MSSSIDTGTFISAALHGAVGFIMLAGFGGTSITGTQYWMFVLFNVGAAFVVDFLVPRMDLKLF